MSAKIGYLEIPVIDPVRAAKFFENVFGWSAHRSDWSGGSHVVLEEAAGDMGCGLAEASAGGLDSPTPVVHLDRAEMQPCLERVVEAGGEVIQEPQPVDHLGSFARFRDSEGNTWGLWAAAGSTSQA